MRGSATTRGMLCSSAIMGFWRKPTVPPFAEGISTRVVARSRMNILWHLMWNMFKSGYLCDFKHNSWYIYSFYLWTLSCNGEIPPGTGSWAGTTNWRLGNCLSPFSLWMGVGGFSKVVSTFNQVGGSFNLFMATTEDVWIIPSFRLRDYMLQLSPFHVPSWIVANISDSSLLLYQ